MDDWADSRTLDILDTLDTLRQPWKARRRGARAALTLPRHARSGRGMNTRFARLSGAGPRLGNGAGNGPGSRRHSLHTNRNGLGPLALGARGVQAELVRTEPRIEAMEAWRLRW